MTHIRSPLSMSISLPPSLPPSLPHSLTHSLTCLLFPPYSSPPSSVHPVFYDCFLHLVPIIHLDFLFSLILPPLSSCCPSSVPLTHLISLSMLFFPLSSTSIPGEKKSSDWVFCIRLLKTARKITHRLAASLMEHCTDTRQRIQRCTKLSHHVT